MSDMPLPPELLHEVLDHLEPSVDSLSSTHPAPWSGTFRTKSDLYSCSLVSRDWNRLTRPHLFHFVKYSFRRSPKEGELPWGPLLLDGLLGRWEEKLASRTQPCPNKTLGMFCKFLEANPAVAPYIRGLSLRCCAGLSHYAGNQVFAYDCDDRIHPSLLARLLNLLPQLRTLRLEDITLACAPTKQALSSLTLGILDISFVALRPSSRDTSALLGCFKNIGELKLTNPGTDGQLPGGEIPSSIDEYGGPEHFSARTLNIRGLLEPAGSLFKSLRRRESSSNINSLYLLCVSPSAVPQLQAFVDALGDRLEEVLFDLTTTASTLDPNFQPAVLDLSHCKALRRLKIGLYVDLDYADASNPNFFHTSRLLAGASLSRLSNPVFEGIVLDVTTMMQYYPYTLARGFGTGIKLAQGPTETVDTAAMRIMRQFPEAKLFVTGVEDVEDQEVIGKSFPRLLQEKKLVFSDSTRAI